MRSSTPASFLRRSSAVFCIALCSTLSCLDAAERIPLDIDASERTPLTFDFTADGELIVVSRKGEVSILDSRTGDLLSRSELELGVRVDNAAFSRQSSCLAVNSHESIAGGRKNANHISVWSYKTGERKRMTSPALQEATHVITMGFSPSGDKLVATTVGRKMKHAVHVWDTETGNEIAVLAKNHNLQLARFSPDGKWLAASGTYGTRRTKGAFFLWRADQFGEATELSSNGANGNFAFSADGRLLAIHTAYATEKQLRQQSILHSPGEVSLWDLESMSRQGVLPGFRGGVVMAFSVDSRLLAASGIRPTGDWGRTAGELVQVWDLSSGRRTVIERDSHASNVLFSPRGDYLLTSFATPTSGFRLRDPSGRVVETINQGKPQDVIGGVVFSPSGDRLAVSIGQSLSGEDRLCLWNLNASSRQADQQ